MMIASRIAQYFRELSLILNIPTGEAVKLFRATAQHHIANWTNYRGNQSSTFALNFADAEITMRPTAGDLTVFYEIFAERDYEIPDDALPPRAVKTIVDCGAHIGLSTLYFARKYPNAQVIAVEPHPANFELLCRNTSQLTNVMPQQCCLSNSRGTEKLSNTGRSHFYRIVRDGEGCSVDALTLADICERSCIATIDLLKIDIEGEEGRVMSNGIPPNVRAIVMELHRGVGYSIDQFRKDAAPRTVFQKAHDIVFAVPENANAKIPPHASGKN